MARLQQRKATTSKATRKVARGAAAKPAKKKSVAVAKKKALAKSSAAPKGKAAPKPAKPVTGRAGKYTYSFGGGRADGRSEMKNLLGGKGANLAEMAEIGLPVPPGFTITTEVCTYYYANGRKYPATLGDDVKKAVAKIEAIVGKKFGDPKNPLLVSVRSGARASMPGMMDTILNLGLNDETAAGIAAASNNERFAYDSYRRFVQMYGDVVLGLKPESDKEHDPFEVVLDAKKEARGVKGDLDLTTQDLKELVREFKQLILRRTGKPFPENPWDQLWGAIGAVFGSWMNQRAITYRKLYNIPADWGTAVNVQAMVFGNLGDDCATGVAFTRDPANGNKKFYGEFLVNAQGEDVVAGIRDPQKVTLEASREVAAAKGQSDDERKRVAPSLEEVMPEAYKQLRGVADKLERHYRDMQDIEFTIERRTLYMLQTRNGKRTAHAAVKIAVDMAAEKLIDRDTAVKRVDPAVLDTLLHRQVDAKAPKDLIAKGLPASPGAAAGEVVFSADDAERAKNEGRKTILVRVETSPEDIHGMHAAEGILTARGGATSHAAVVGRGMGKPCVVGCNALQIDYVRGEMVVGAQLVRAGDAITIDGATGAVYRGLVPTVEPTVSGDFSKLMGWADKARKLKVRANADTPHDAKVAREFGAEGIGLCRTEHMFFEGDRIDAVREMILADGTEGRRRALAKILPMQKDDFKGIFRAMNGLPVTIRLLDPPLHEFIPHTDEEIAELAVKIGVNAEKLRAKRDSLQELNPMLGHRGCRLGVTFPEIYEIQVRAIMEAACELAREKVKVVPEIMIPLVGVLPELAILRELTVSVASAVMTEYRVKVAYTVGTMIEVPRAAIVAKDIAGEAEFFSFGTNDLTQMTFGLSRDDAGKFLPEYIDRNVYAGDPFVSIDQSGVGFLMERAVKEGRAGRPGLKCGICGEHGGDPASVIFCHKTGLDYVSCSPYRVPVARLAAAHAALGA
ncbi:MAG: pyruvate, phosphate dikinase [Deltaproteobacteria bacterium]|nr:pyruvate, phosphate dikinase [Deltaproteobacteria bacterium]